MNNLLELIPKVLLQLWTEHKETKEVTITRKLHNKLRHDNELGDYLYAQGIDIRPGKMYHTKETVKSITFTQEVDLYIKPHPNFIFFDDYNEAAHLFDPDAVHVKARDFKADFSLISKDNHIHLIRDFCDSVINDLVKNNFIRGQKLEIRINQHEWGDIVDLRIRQIYVYKDIDKYQYMPMPVPTPFLPDGGYNSLIKMIADEKQNPKQLEEETKIDTTPRYLTEPIVISETIKAYDQSES